MNIEPLDYKICENGFLPMFSSALHVVRKGNKETKNGHK